MYASSCRNDQVLRDIDLITIGDFRGTDSAFDPVLQGQHFFLEDQVVLKVGLSHLVGAAGDLVDVVGDVAQQEDDGLQLRFDVGRHEIALVGVGQGKGFEAGGRLHLDARRAGADCGVLGLGQRAVDALRGGAVIEAGVHLAPHVLPELAGRGKGRHERGKA